MEENVIIDLDSSDDLRFIQFRRLQAVNGSTRYENQGILSGDIFVSDSMVLHILAGARNCHCSTHWTKVEEIECFFYSSVVYTCRTCLHVPENLIVDGIVKERYN